MFRFLAKLIFGDRSRRAIFSYHDGNKKRYADPLVALRGLDDHPTFNMDRDLQGIEHGDEESVAKAVQATRDVFGLTPWSEENRWALTETETIDLLAYFLNWTERLKKNIENSTTSPASSDATPDNSSEPITSDTSPSTSSEAEPSSAEQT